MYVTLNEVLLPYRDSTKFASLVRRKLQDKEDYVKHNISKRPEIADSRLASNDIKHFIIKTLSEKTKDLVKFWHQLVPIT